MNHESPYMKYFSSFLMLVAILPFIGGGCFQSAEESYAEQAIESQTGGSVDVNIDDDTVTYEDTQTGGSMVYGEDIDLPDDFPKDLPVYDGTITINSTLNLPGQGVTLNFTTSDSQEDVLAWYEDTLESSGWTQQMSYNMQEQMMRAYIKDDVTINISAAHENNLTNVTILRIQNQ